MNDQNKAFLFHFNREISLGKLPTVAKIVKGQYLNLGVSNLSHSKNVNRVVLLMDAGRCIHAVAQPIQIKGGKKITTNSSEHFLVPETFEGFFEILSEDGKAMQSYENVFEISHRKNSKVLVRDTFVIRSNNCCMTLNAGDIITPLSLVDNGNLLQCRTSKNHLVSIPHDCKAKFSPIAIKGDSISGVHSVSKFINIYFFIFINPSILAYFVREMISDEELTPEKVST